MVEKKFKAIWRCESPHETHKMDEEVFSSLDELKEKAAFEHADECDHCRDYNDAYIGILDEIKVYEDGEEIEALDPSEMVDEFGRWK